MVILPAKRDARGGKCMSMVRRNRTKRSGVAGTREKFWERPVGARFLQRQPEGED